MTHVGRVEVRWCLAGPSSTAGLACGCRSRAKRRHGCVCWDGRGLGVDAELPTAGGWTTDSETPATI